MKRLFIIFLISILFSCQESEKHKAERIAKEYLTALRDGEWDKAKTFGTEETQKHMDIMCPRPVFWIREAKDIMCVLNESEDKARCTFCCAVDSIYNELSMIKIDDKWLVHIPKEVPPLTDSTSIDE